MKLILRMAYNRSDPQRAEEARRLLRTTPVHSFSLIQRIALSNGDTQRAQAAQELLKIMREPSTKPGHPLALLKRISTSSDDMSRQDRGGLLSVSFIHSEKSERDSERHFQLRSAKR